MTTDTSLARRAGIDITTIDDAERLARIAVSSGLTALRRPEEAAVILLTGRELGLAPMQSLRGIHVVQGRPVLSADLMVAIVRRSGLCASWRTVESTPETCTIETRREGETEAARKTWTMADATRAGLGPSKGGNWKAYPAQMLRHRCASDLAREVYPDVVLGLYDPDELGAVEPRGTLEAVVLEPAPSPAVPDVDPDASRAYAAYVTAVEGAASCQAVAAAWMALLPALRLEGHDPAEWTTDALALAVRRVADLGVVGAKGALREIATSTGDLPGLVDELLAQPAAAVPQWVASRADVLRTLAAPGPEIVRVVAARRYGGVATLDTASTAAAGRALAEAVAALSAREPGDDDEPPPSAPQPPPQGRRTRATATGPSNDSAPADGPAAWLGDDAAAEAHAAGWSHARHVEASVRRHAPTVAGDAYDRLVRVATARMEALSQPDAYGTRPTAAGLHRTVSRWAAEGPVAARRAA